MAVWMAARKVARLDYCAGFSMAGWLAELTAELMAELKVELLDAKMAYRMGLRLAGSMDALMAAMTGERTVVSKDLTTAQ